MGVQDYIQPPVGGSITGYRNITTTESGFVNTVTEGAWIAVYVFFIMYTVILLLFPLWESHFLKEEVDSAVTVVSPTPPELSIPEITRASSEIQRESSSPPSGKQVEIYEGYMLMGYAFRDSFLLLLGTTLIGMNGYGLSGDTLALIWITFALLTIMSIGQLIPNRLLSALIELTTFFIGAVLLIVIWAIQFRPAVSV